MKNIIPIDSDINNIFTDTHTVDTVINYELAMSELKKVYWHEKQLLIAIRLLLCNADTDEMVESLTVLGEYTKDHVEKLETNFPSISKVA